MAHHRALLTAVLACIAALACSDAHAQARGLRGKVLQRPPLDLKDPVQRDAMMAKLGTWLGRLNGKFRYEGIAQFGFGDERVVKGTQDCWGVGEGPGLLCLINMTWPDIGSLGQQGPISRWEPALALFGIGPTAAEINFMQLDSSGMPEGIPAKLQGENTVRFTVPCTNEPTVCRKTVRITAGPDGEPIQLKIEKWSNYYGDMLPAMIYILSLHRMTETAE